MREEVNEREEEEERRGRRTGSRVKRRTTKIGRDKRKGSG